MKEFLKEYTKIIVSILCTVLFSLGFYNIFINLLHQNHISQNIVVSNLDNNYNAFQENVLKISNNLNNYVYKDDSYYDIRTMEKLRGNLKICFDFLNDDEGLSGIKLNDHIKPFDLYQINSYFVNEIINRCWISSLGFINLEENDYEGYFDDVFPQYDRSVKLLTNNSNYVKDELLNNSSYHYNTLVTKNTVRNDFLSQYNMVINNYKVFSDIIVEISDFLVKGEY